MSNLHGLMKPLSGSKKLAAIFNQNEQRYQPVSYSEAQARKDFIDKFWIALGWDVKSRDPNRSLQARSQSRARRRVSELRKRLAGYLLAALRELDI